MSRCPATLVDCHFTYECSGKHAGSRATGLVHTAHVFFDAVGQPGMQVPVEVRWSEPQPVPG